MPDTDRRPNPDQLLAAVEAQERNERRGKLKIFLGYAGGVGKSFRMFDEGRRRKLRGQDVVVAATQPSASAESQELLSRLGSHPAACGRWDSGHRCRGGSRRHPQICLIDGLAYRNPAGQQA